MLYTAQTSIEDAPTHPRSLATVTQFCQKYPAFSVGGLRWLLFHRDANGLTAAVVRVGRRVLLDEERFFQWLDRQNGHLPGR